MKKLIIDLRSSQLPESWDELTEKQFMRACFVRAQHFHDSDDIALNASRIVLFRILTGTPLRRIGKISAAEWLDILPHMNFIFSTPVLSKNPVQVIHVPKLGKLYGPQGMLDNSMFDELITADRHFTQANLEGEEQLIRFYKLFCTLWRPERKDIKQFRSDTEKWNGDNREPINSNLINDRAQLLMQHLPLWKVLPAFIYYWAFRSSTLEKEYPKIFEKSSGSGTGVNYGWAGFLLEISGSK